MVKVIIIIIGILYTTHMFCKHNQCLERLRQSEHKGTFIVEMFYSVFIATVEEQRSLPSPVLICRINRPTINAAITEGSLVNQHPLVKQFYKRVLVNQTTRRVERSPASRYFSLHRPWSA